MRQTIKNNLKLDADTTIYAKKIDGVMTKVDKPETITEIKELNCYGGLLDQINKVNAENSTLKPLTLELFREVMNKLNEEAMKPRVHQVFMSVNQLKMTNLDDLFFNTDNISLLVNSEGADYIANWKKEKLKKLEERKAFILQKYSNPRKSIVKELDKKINKLKDDK